jgi:hypothetical protein
MTAHIVAIAGANALMLVLGAGLLPQLRLARTRREIAARLPLAYAVGVAATGIVAADLAVVEIPVGWIALAILATLSLAFGLRRAGPGGGGAGLLPRAGELPALAILGVATAFLVWAARLFAVKPLADSDGWAIWGLRARALYVFGHPIAPVFTSEPYQALQHPLWLPALEALDFRAMSGFDGTVVHLQLFGLAVAFIGGAWLLLRDHAPRLMLAATLLAILTAPTFFNQLPSNFADVPLAMLVALGSAALVAWLRSDGVGLLPAAALFLGAGAITKNEGELFALAAFVAAAAVARRGQRRPLAWAALAVLAIDLPWRVWVQLHHVQIAEYSLSNLFSVSYLRAHSNRVWPSAHELLFQIRSTASWSYLVLLALVALASALLLRRFRLVLYSTLWLLLSFAGLVAIYWISTKPLAYGLSGSSDRTIDTLVIGGALLAPVLLRVERD